MSLPPHRRPLSLMRVSVASLRRVVKGDVRIEFVRQDLTSHGGLVLLRRYARRIGSAERLRRASAGLTGHYRPARVALLILALFYVGARRLAHLRDVAGDPLSRGSAGWPGCRARAPSATGSSHSRRPPWRRRSS